MITSLSNEKVKLVRALGRRRTRWQERRFFIEGSRLLSEVLRREIEPSFVFYTAATADSPDSAPLLDRLAEQGIACYQVSDEVMAACSDTVTPPGLLAVVPFPNLPLPERATCTLVVDKVRTPGNLGAILRSAAASGVDQALLAPGTVDPYNPKVVRGGAGAHFCLPLLPLSWPEIQTRLQGLEVWLAAAEGELPYTGMDWRRPLALIIGGEARGASPAALARADGLVTIPMARGVESLNVAVATGVLLFEIARQRRAAGRGWK
jgi:TrmH family RNA methyltransferase